MGTLLGVAIGDAFGAGYEFRYKTREEYANPTLEYLVHPNADFNQTPGMYTDDTQMSIAVAETMLAFQCLWPITPEALTDKFVECYKRDPINGYARGFQEFLEEIDSGKEFRKNIRPFSSRNGAAMRSVPFGFYQTPDDVIQVATVNASTTHNTPQGIASSVAVGLLSWMYDYHGEVDGVEVAEHVHTVLPAFSDYLLAVNAMKEIDYELLLGSEWKDKGVPCDGMYTTGAVLYILNNYDTVEDILLESVKLGGDTDSVASIALGIYGPSPEEIPAHLYKGLTNHAYGRDYIEELDRKLEKAF